MPISDIISDNVDFIETRDTKIMFSTEYNYDDYKEKLQEANKRWKNLPTQEKERYRNNIKNYYRDEIKNIPPEHFDGVKNYSLLINELRKRLHDFPYVRTLAIDQLNYEQSLTELLENLENVERIKNLYKIRKRTVGEKSNSGLTTEESDKIRCCLRQGRELFLSGKSSLLMVKPLIYFYSLTAYAYAIVILNNPIRYAIRHLPNSHGLNYTKDGFHIQFGGDFPHGTLSELFCSFPTISHINKEVEFEQGNINSCLELFNRAYTTDIGVLLSMVPEIREYYKIATSRDSRTHPLTVTSSRSSRSRDYEFHIGDGSRMPNKEIAKNSFQGFEMSDKYGKIIVNIPPTEIHNVTATIYTDLSGHLWFIENPFFPLVIPELCLHFLLTCAFSNIMRYAPDIWGNILFNEGDSNISLIIRKYLSAFESKFVALILRHTSPYAPYIEFNQ